MLVLTVVAVQGVGPVAMLLLDLLMLLNRLLWRLSLLLLLLWLLTLWLFLLDMYGDAAWNTAAITSISTS